MLTVRKLHQDRNQTTFSISQEPLSQVSFNSYHPSCMCVAEGRYNDTYRVYIGDVNIIGYKLRKEDFVPIPGSAINFRKGRLKALETYDKWIFVATENDVYVLTINTDGSLTLNQGGSGRVYDPSQPEQNIQSLSYDSLSHQVFVGVSLYSEKQPSILFSYVVKPDGTITQKPACIMSGTTSYNQIDYLAHPQGTDKLIASAYSNLLVYDFKIAGSDSCAIKEISAHYKVDRNILGFNGEYVSQ